MAEEKNNPKAQEVETPVVETPVAEAPIAEAPVAAALVAEALVADSVPSLVEQFDTVPTDNIALNNETLVAVNKQIKSTKLY